MFLPSKFISRAPLLDMRRELDRIFDAFAELPVSAGLTAFPPVNVFEDGEKLVVEAELPGLKMEDLDISASADELTIKGKRVEEKSDAAFHRRERVMGEFVRVLSLPTDVDADRVEATLQDGVLTVTLPKAAVARTRKITVKAN